jgi:hypothetical protein
MTATNLVACSALVMASLAGALLARSDYSLERSFSRSQWPTPLAAVEFS